MLRVTKILYDTPLVFPAVLLTREKMNPADEDISDQPQTLLGDFWKCDYVRMGGEGKYDEATPSRRTFNNRSNGEQGIIRSSGYQANCQYYS